METTGSFDYMIDSHPFKAYERGVEGSPARDQAIIEVSGLCIVSGPRVSVGCVWIFMW